LFTWLAVLMLGGSLMRRRREPRVPPSAASAFRDDESIARHSEVVQHFAGRMIVDHRSDRCHDIDRITVVTFTIAAFAMAAALGFVFRIKAEMQKCIVVLAGDHHHVAATAAIAATRPAARDELLASERKTPVTAISGFDGDDYFIDKHLIGNAAVGRSGRES